MADPMIPANDRSGKKVDSRLPLLVIHVMNPGVIQIPGDVSIGEAARLMHKEQVPCLLIKDTESKIGLVTHTDIVYKVVAQGLNPDDIESRLVMSRPVQSIEFDRPLEEVTHAFTTSDTPFLIVMKQNQPVGILSPQDILTTTKLSQSRIKAKVKNYMDRPEGVEHPAVISQLNHLGAFVETKASMPPGTRVTLVFSLPDTTKTLSLEATVLDRSQESSNPQSKFPNSQGVVPVQFNDISLSSQSQIHSWLSQVRSKKNRNP